MSLSLGIKAALFALALLAVRGGLFGPFTLVAFAALVAYLYIRPLFRTLALFPAFAVLTLFSIFFIERIPEPYLLAGAAYAGVLFYLLLGIKHLAFVHRTRVYMLFSLFTAYMGFLTFADSVQGGGFTMKLFGLFLAIGLLARPLFVRGVTPWFLALIVTEGLWAASFLPIGPIQTASLAFIVLFTATRLFLYREEGALNRPTLLQEGGAFAALATFILLVSRWTF